MDKKMLYDYLNFIKSMSKEEFQAYESKLKPLNIDYSKYEDPDFEILLCKDFSETLNVWNEEFKISEFSVPKLKLKSKNIDEDGFFVAISANAA